MKIAFTYNQQRTHNIEEAEFDTPEVIAAISKALSYGNHRVINIEMTKDGKWINHLKECNPDLIFNTTEGFHGTARESYAPIVFEQLQLPYVGSGAYSCFLTLDKFLSKQIVASENIPIPEGHFISDQSEIDIISKELDYPVFVKPNFEGSSKGITKKSKCLNKKEFSKYASKCLTDFPSGIIVERYIEGKDITVPYIAGLNRDGVLDVIEYTNHNVSGSWVYDYDLKNHNDESVGVKCPADISDASSILAKSYVKRIVRVLNICDMARVDFRITPNGEVFFIEINALPSLQPNAGLFEASQLIGLNYEQTIDAIVQAASKRHKLSQNNNQPGRKLIKRDPKISLVYNLKRKDKSDVNYEVEAEFDSEETINSIKDAIESAGHKIEMIEADRDLAQNLIDRDVDIVFNIAEGLNKQTREAQVPAVCDLLGIEHTGSDASCLAITLNKSLTGKLMLSEGLLTPKSHVYSKKIKKVSLNFNYPIIIKPNLEGTSKGIHDNSVVHNDNDLQDRVNALLQKYNTPVLCEEYIVGREFTVGLIGGRSPQVIGILEIDFKDKDKKYPVYSFEAKQLDNQRNNKVFQMVCPADINKKLERRITQFAKKAFSISGCRDVARLDLRVTASDEIYFLEINPLPGLSPGFSDLTIMAECVGMSYNDLIGKILKPALGRWRKSRFPLQARG